MEQLKVKVDIHDQNDRVTATAPEKGLEIDW